MRPQQLQFIYLTTLDSVQRLYQNDFSALQPFLHPDITWIRSRDSQCLKGKVSVSEALSAFCLPHSFSHASLNCRILCCDQQSCTLLCTSVVGRHRTHCITFVWKEEQHHPKIIHIHGSVTHTAVHGAALKPPESNHSAEPCVIFTGQHAERYYLRPCDILYVEADNICSRLICKNQTLYISQSISTVQELLPDCFLKIHRSFLVNVKYITSLRRYTIELQGNISLPVPEKKYKWLREYLDQYSRRPGQ